MWTIGDLGTFSIVQKPGRDDLAVRARVREDLERFRARYLDPQVPILDHAGTDYPYRLFAPHHDVAKALYDMVLRIDYPNFKSHIHQAQGSTREHVYHEVHSALIKLEKLDHAAARPADRPHPTRAADRSSIYTSTLAPAAGGVVFNDQGKLLLVEPTGHFDNTVWTFPKGRLDADDTPEAAAVREGEEESGAVARIVAPVPGSWQGSASETCYFVMTLVEQHFEPNAEAQAFAWIDPSEAPDYINKTTKSSARTRDLEVLQAALAVRRRHKMESNR